MCPVPGLLLKLASRKGNALAERFWPASYLLALADTQWRGAGLWENHRCRNNGHILSWRFLFGHTIIKICVSFPQAESSQRRPFCLLLSVGKARINNLHESQVSGGPRAWTIHPVWLGAHTRNSRVVWLVRRLLFPDFFFNPLT